MGLVCDPAAHARTIHLSGYVAFQIIEQHHMDILLRNRKYLIDNIAMADFRDRLVRPICGYDWTANRSCERALVYIVQMSSVVDK